MSAYREFTAPTALARAVECLWTLTPEPGDTPHRVLPDGCIDILFTRGTSNASIEAVGPMTGYRDFAIPADRRLFGVRFRPGGWPRQWAQPCADTQVPFEDVSGLSVLDELADTINVREQAQILARVVPIGGFITPAQRAIAALERAHGCIPIEELASQAGLSPRQFRRVCLSLTGLTPKFLARVLRFRHAQSHVAASGAAHALDCGYYDQPHFINEWRRFSGQTPMAVFSNRAGMAAR